MKGQIVKYLIRKPLQTIGGAAGGIVSGFVVGLVSLKVFKTYIKTENVSIDTENIIVMSPVVGGFIVGAGVGLYL